MRDWGPLSLAALVQASAAERKAHTDAFGAREVLRLAAALVAGLVVGRLLAEDSVVDAAWVCLEAFATMGDNTYCVLKLSQTSYLTSSRSSVLMVLDAQHGADIKLPDLLSGPHADVFTWEKSMEAYLAEEIRERNFLGVLANLRSHGWVPTMSQSLLRPADPEEPNPQQILLRTYYFERSVTGGSAAAGQNGIGLALPATGAAPEDSLPPTSGGPSTPSSGPPGVPGRPGGAAPGGVRADAGPTGRQHVALAQTPPGAGSTATWPTKPPAGPPPGTPGPPGPPRGQPPPFVRMASNRTRGPAATPPRSPPPPPPMNVTRQTSGRDTTLRHEALQNLGAVPQSPGVAPQVQIPTHRPQQSRGAVPPAHRGLRTPSSGSALRVPPPPPFRPPPGQPEVPTAAPGMPNLLSIPADHAATEPARAELAARNAVYFEEMKRKRELAEAQKVADEERLSPEEREKLEHARAEAKRHSALRSNHLKKFSSSYANPTARKALGGRGGRGRGRGGAARSTAIQ